MTEDTLLQSNHIYQLATILIPSTYDTLLVIKYVTLRGNAHHNQEETGRNH